MFRAASFLNGSRAAVAPLVSFPVQAAIALGGSPRAAVATREYSDQSNKHRIFSNAVTVYNMLSRIPSGDDDEYPVNVKIAKDDQGRRRIVVEVVSGVVNLDDCENFLESLPHSPDVVVDPHLQSDRDRESDDEFDLLPYRPWYG